MALDAVDDVRVVERSSHLQARAHARWLREWRTAGRGAGEAARTGMARHTVEPSCRRTHWFGAMACGATAGGASGGATYGGGEAGGFRCFM